MDTSEILRQWLENRDSRDRLFGPGTPGTYTTKLNQPCSQCGGELVSTRVLLGPPYSGLVTCTQCTFTEGFRNWVMKLIFPVQKLPEGALPLDWEPSWGAILEDDLVDRDDS